MEKRLVVVNTVMNLRVIQNWDIFLLVENPLAIQGNFCHIKLVIYWNMVILGKPLVVQLFE